MLKTSINLGLNLGWLGVASTVVLGALACAECYVQESARLAAAEQPPSWTAAAEAAPASPR